MASAVCTANASRLLTGETFKAKPSRLATALIRTPQFTLTNATNLDRKLFSFFLKFMFFKISGCAHFLCYLQHLGAGTLEFASHLQHFGAETFHFECYLQHFIFGTFLSACYLQHLGAGTNDICSIFELQLSILHGNFLFG